MNSLTIGIDFDNTIIRYDEVIYQLAREMDLVPTDIAHDKTIIRDFIRTIENGNTQWQRLQGQLYGMRLPEASIAIGFKEFVIECRNFGVKLFVVSHKTQFGHFDAGKKDLRVASLEWMEAMHFFSTDGLGFSKSDIFFNSTREEKIAKIRELQCSIFIDDLIEVLTEPDFPSECRKILYASTIGVPVGGIEVYATWKEITAAITFDTK